MEASVVIPFYNAEATLARAIDSVLAQQNVTLEILLIDNNSTDKSRAIAQSYVDKYKHIALSTEATHGANHARNLGLSLATKEWIQYLDADDELLPFKIFNQLSINDIKDNDVVLSPYREYTLSGNIIDYEIDSFNDIQLSLLLGKYGITTSILWRKKALEFVNGWNINQFSHQELELLFRLSINNRKFFYFNKSESIVHEQINSISNSTEFPISGVLLMKEIEEYFIQNKTLSIEREKAIQNQIYNKLLWAFKINSEETKPYLNLIKLKLDLIIRPWYHKILTRLVGIENTFAAIKWISSVR